MNSNSAHLYFCPIPGCTHLDSATTTPFPSKLALLRHLNSVAHRPTHHLTDLSQCTRLDIFHCCCTSCPSSPRTFFPSLRSLTIHTDALHSPPTHNVSTPGGHAPHPASLDIRSLQVTIATQFPHQFSLNNTLNHWDHGISFISTSYDHEPTDFRTTWRHILKGRNKASFVNLQTSIIKAIVTSYNTTWTFARRGLTIRDR